MPPLMPVRASLLLFLGVVAVATPRPASAQVAHCAEAERFLVQGLGMKAIVDPDTLDDWRTKVRTPGCRVTAAGLADIGVAREAVRFYERLRSAGWVRTPEPMDSPNEASLRFRKAGVDCLFNVYEGALLNTDSEIAVSTALVPAAGQSRYNVLALCIAAKPAGARQFVDPEAPSRRVETPASGSVCRVFPDCPPAAGGRGFAGLG